MKNFLLLLGFLSFCISVNSQDRNDTYRFSFGVNAIDNSGRQSPFSNINDWAFIPAITIIGFEYRISNLFTIEELFSLNKFSSGYKIDGVALNKDLRYFSADTNIKYYIGEYFLNSEKIDLFLTAGLGFYDYSVTFASANLGGGFVFWFNDDIGIGVQSLGKFTLGDKDKQFSSNHLQYFLQLIYRN